MEATLGYTDTTMMHIYAASDAALTHMDVVIHLLVIICWGENRNKIQLNFAEALDASKSSRNAACALPASKTAA